MKHTKHIYTRIELNSHIKHWFDKGFLISDIDDNQITMKKGDNIWILVTHFR